jgi:uncharacterized protein (TIGR03067 family)
MDRRMRFGLAAALSAGPLMLGAAVATWFAWSTQFGPHRRQNVEAVPERVVPGPVPDDLSEIQGTWEGVSLEREGRLVYEGAAARQARVSFLGDAVIFQDRGTTLAGTFHLDPAAMPKTFDLTIDEEGEEVAFPAGIYELEEETFRLCFSYPADERPTSFVTYPGSGRTLIVYRRLGASRLPGLAQGRAGPRFALAGRG